LEKDIGQNYDYRIKIPQKWPLAEMHFLNGKETSCH